MNRKPTTHTSAKTFRGSALQTPWLMCLALLAVLGFATSAWATTETLTDTNNWTVPAGVTSVTVEMWGAGGGGGAKAVSGSAGRGSGGGGGGYSRATIAVTPGSFLAYSVGAGGAGGLTNPITAPLDGGPTTFAGVTTANGGAAGTNKTSATIVGGGPGGTGLTANGGAGAVDGGNNNNGGNGGGAGGFTAPSTAVNGGAGSGTGNVAGVGGGTAPSKGGNGGVAGSGLTGGSGNTPGGGGAGGSGASGPQNNGGAGAGGSIILTYTAASSTPIVESPTKSGITTTTATLGATVVTNSGSTIDDYGIVYSQTSLNNDPTVGGGSVIKVQKGTSIANGTAFTTNIVGLTAGTQYSFKGYAHTTSGYGYSTPATSFFTLANEPTVQASSASVTNTQRGAFAITWTRGNGANCIVLVKAGSAVDSAPVDGTTYTASTVFGSGTQIGSGNYVAYLGTGNSVTLSNMTIGTTYYVAVYELNGAGGSENYLTTSPATSSAAATGNIYYSIGANPTAPSNWTNSLGFSPVNFNGGDTFVILSGQSITASDSWTNNNGATLIIQSGATLDMFDASRKLLINGNFVNNGTLINSFDSSAPIVNFINSFSAGAGTDFTSTLTVGTNYNVSVVAIGGGGGGASAGNPSNSIPVTGGGGGGGASAYSTNLVLQAGIGYQVTVGANGARGTAGSGFGNPGGAGGASSFGGGFLTSIIANGGAGGSVGDTNGASVGGAGGAVGSSGNAANFAGGSAVTGGGGGGGAAGDGDSGANASAGTGGSGGSGVVTPGGAGGSVTANTAGANAGAPGGGGSGASWTSGANKAGGAGGVGWVSVQLISTDNSASSLTYKYQSRASGDWNNFNTWSVDKGSGFVNAASGETPNAGHSNVVVQASHTVSVAAAAVSVNLTVNSGGILTVNGSLAVNRLTGQTIANNLTVNGTLNLASANSLSLGNNTTNLIAVGAVLNQTAAAAISQGTGVQLTINGSYVQNATGSGVIPVATWGSASTCQINSTFTSNIDAAANDVQLNYGQAFANFIWNAQGGTTNVVYRMTKSTIANWTVGNLTISNTAGTPARLELAGTQPLSVSVTNLTMTGGNFRAGGSGSALTVKGSLAISAGTFDTGGTITALDTVSMTGSADVMGNAPFSFAKAGAQSWTVTTTNELTGLGWTVNSGTALTLGSASRCVVNDLTVNGTLAVTGNSTLVVNGFSAPSTNNSGYITVASGSTLGGGGAIGANITLSAGAFATNTVAFDTNNVPNGQLTVTNALTLNGNTIYVSTGTNVLAAGNYVLITNTSGGITGSFGSVVISGAGLAANTTSNLVTTAGAVTLQVISTVVAPPVITSTVLSGSNLIISGTNATATAGGTYYVRASTDVTVPIASWPRISTNIYGVGGTISASILVAPGVPQRFYRIEE